MSAWIFIIGLVLLWAGVSSRLARRERRSLELAALDYPVVQSGPFTITGKVGTHPITARAILPLSLNQSTTCTII
jgi:hypothetical protein